MSVFKKKRRGHTTVDPDIRDTPDHIKSINPHRAQQQPNSNHTENDARPRHPTHVYFASTTPASDKSCEGGHRTRLLHTVAVPVESSEPFDPQFLLGATINM